MVRVGLLELIMIRAIKTPKTYHDNTNVHTEKLEYDYYHCTGTYTATQLAKHHQVNERLPTQMILLDHWDIPRILRKATNNVLN